MECRSVKLKYVYVNIYMSYGVGFFQNSKEKSDLPQFSASDVDNPEQMTILFEFPRDTRHFTSIPLKTE